MTSTEGQGQDHIPKQLVKKKEKKGKKEAFRERKHLQVHDFKAHAEKRSLNDTFRNEFVNSWLKHIYTFF